MTIDQFITICDQIENEQELFHLLQKELRALGFDIAIFSLLTNHTDLETLATQGLFKNNTGSWIDELISGNYNALDPFRSHCFYGHGALTLAQLKNSEQLTNAQIKFIQSTESAGIHDRITVALRGGSGAVASLDIARTYKQEPPSNACVHKMNALCQHFYIAFCQLRRSGTRLPFLTLTGKEREVLEWSAKGFTKAEIGVRLHISSHTVDYHSRKLARKLGARNITAAAVNALNRGLIHVS